jgi:hypothetical protein
MILAEPAVTTENHDLISVDVNNIASTRTESLGHTGFIALGNSQDCFQAKRHSNIEKNKCRNMGITQQPRSPERLVIWSHNRAMSVWRMDRPLP